MNNLMPKRILIKHRYLYLAVVVLLAMSGCLPSMSLNSQFDRSVDFQVYRTFALLDPEAANTSADPTLYEPLLDRRVRDAVAAELVKRGLMLDAENPDLLVAYDVAVAQDAPNASPDFGYSYWFGYRYSYNTADFPSFTPIGRYTPGTLVIDLIAATPNELVWRGVAEGGINPAQTDERKIRTAIARILSQYPPTPPLR